MSTTTVVTLDIGSAERCHEVLDEFFSALGYVRHPRASEVTCEPGAGPYSQLLIVRTKGQVTESEASGITDEVVSRVLGRTSGDLTVRSYTFQNVATPKR